MTTRIVKTRARYFVAVEGESEQSFVRWLQEICDQRLHVHLDCIPLGGGGFKSMLEKAVRSQKRRGRTGVYRASFLLVDADRAEQGDWSIEQLRRQADQHRIFVCAQHPNHEGLLLRMLPGMEREKPEAAATETRLKGRWPGYQKPMNARAFGRQFSLDDRLRAANFDSDLRTLLRRIGIYTE